MVNKIHQIDPVFLITFLLQCTGNIQSKPFFQRSPSVDSDLPSPVGYVNDFEDLLSPEEQKSLETRLAAFERKTSNEITIVTFSGLSDYPTIFDYTYALARSWGVGKRDKNNGILIGLSDSLRQIRIQNGLGIEDQFTDYETKVVIDSLMIPAFKERKFFDGFSKALDEIEHELE